MHLKITENFEKSLILDILSKVSEQWKQC